MAFPTTATLEYTITATNVTPGRLNAAMAAVPLYQSADADPVLFGLYDSQVTSDTTATGGSDVTRTIVITLGAGFFLLFPTDAAWGPVFNGQYTATLMLALCADVVETPVVFA